MKAVILAGGLGTRFTEETSLRPKPMVEIGGRPILWHIMKIYAAPRHQRLRHLLRLQGLRDQGVFRQLLPAHVRRHLRHAREPHGSCTRSAPSRGRVTLVDTGDDSHDRRPPEARRRLCAGRRSFLLHLWRRRRRRRHHRARSPSTARTASSRRSPPPSRPAASARSTIEDGQVTSFQEKPQGDGGMINGGFFVLDPAVLDYIEGDDTLWEQEPLRELAARRRADGLRAPRLLAADGHAARQAACWKSSGTAARRRGRSG